MSRDKAYSAVFITRQAIGNAIIFAFVAIYACVRSVYYAANPRYLMFECLILTILLLIVVRISAWQSGDIQRGSARLQRTDSVFTAVARGVGEEVTVYVSVGVLILFALPMITQTRAPKQPRTIEESQTKDGVPIRKATINTFQFEPAGKAAFSTVREAREAFEAGEEQLREGHYQLAAQSYDRSNRKLPTLSAQLNLTFIASKDPSAINMQFVLEPGRRLAELRNDKQFQEAFLINTAAIYVAQGKDIEAYKTYELLLEVAKQLGQPDTEGIALLALDRLHARVQGNTPSFTSEEAVNVIRNVLVRAKKYPRTANNQLKLATDLFDRIREDPQTRKPEVLRSLREALLVIRDDQVDTGVAYWQLASRLVSYPYVNNVGQFAVTPHDFLPCKWEFFSN